MIKDMVVGLLFILNADGQLDGAPLVMWFETLQQCQQARTETKAAFERQVVDGELHMACVTRESFSDGSA